jgi:hypothetical protein
MQGYLVFVTRNSELWAGQARISIEKRTRLAERRTVENKATAELFIQERGGKLFLRRATTPLPQDRGSSCW